MHLFNWIDSKYSVNIKELDQQHQKLMGLIDCLHNAKQNNNEQNLLGKVLDDLVDYTKYHFKKEETLMEQHEYPDYSDHKSKHDNLVQQASSMQKMYYLGSTDITTDIAILLNDWIAEHILVEDKKYAPYING